MRRKLAFVFLCMQIFILFEGEGVPTIPDDLKADYVDPTHRQPDNIPFEEGEELSFKLGWGIFSVALSEMVTEQLDYSGTPAYRIQLRTQTNAFADGFYRVRNTSESWIAKDLSGSFLYRAEQSEGKRERNTEARFDTTALKAQYTNFNSEEGPRDPVDILPGAYDPLGIVFYIRTLDFEVGDRLVIPTSNGKEFFYTIVHVKDKVKRKFRYGGRQWAYILEPDIKDIGGVFKRSSNSALRFFFSADDAKLPLRMESEVAVGKFWAELDSVGATNWDELNYNPQDKHKERKRPSRRRTP